MDFVIAFDRCEDGTAFYHLPVIHKSSKKMLDRFFCKDSSFFISIVLQNNNSALHVKVQNFRFRKGIV